MTAPDMADVMDAPESPELRTNRDGSLRKKPGPKPGTRRGSSPRRTAPAPGLRAPSVAKKSSSAVDYRPAILGLAQIPQVALSVAARMVKNEETKVGLQLDGVTIGLHAGNIAEALNRTAQTEKSLAQVLDKLSTVGPYSLVVMALLVPVMQVLANHNVVQANEQMGIYDRETLIQMTTAPTA